MCTWIRSFLSRCVTLDNFILPAPAFDNFTAPKSLLPLQESWKVKGAVSPLGARLCSCKLPTGKPPEYQYLDSGFRQVCAHGQPLSHHHIWVVSLLEGLLQGLQLLGSEGRATPPLFAVLGSITCLQNDVLKCTAVGRQGKWPI